MGATQGLDGTMWRQHLIDETDADTPLRQCLADFVASRRQSRQKLSGRASEGLSAYLKAISRIPLLTRKDEGQLAARVRKGDTAAKERMVLANLRLVISIARRYQGMGIPLADLIGEGNLGLIKAVERYKYEKGFRRQVVEKR